MLYTDHAPCLYDVTELYGEDYEGAMSDYPIWDEAKRPWLNQMIYEHFLYREIAQDTPAMFLFFLRRRMREMMPTLNPIFAALDNISTNDVLTSYKTVDTQEQSTHQEAGALTSTTPQTQLSGAKNYATGLNEQKSDASTEGTSTHYGQNESVADMLRRWASNVNNGLYLVYDGLEPLFQQVWQTEEEY